MAETMEAFAKRHGITAVAVRAAGNPNVPDARADMRHWTVTLSRTLFPVAPSAPDRRLTLSFSQGPAHNLPPTAADVLGCLASDYSGGEGSFEEFCADFGYDTDSRRAETIYRAVVEQNRKLRVFLGPKLLAEILRVKW